MSTKREQILSSLKTSLESVSGVQLYRSRVEAISRKITPAIVVEPGKDLASSQVIPKIDWSFLVVISVITRGEVPDQIADPIIESIHEQVMSDLSIGGLAMGIEPVSYDPILLEGDQPIGIFENIYRVSYRTDEKDLTQ